MTAGFTPAPDHITRPTLTGQWGMAASTHWLATGTAQSVLERGGNAFDAAVAAGFMLHVVEPHLNGPGGELVGMFAAANGDPTVLAGQGPAPAAATVDRFRAEGLDRVPGSGALAAAVPGAVEAWLWLLEHHGTWPVIDVLEYAAACADTGYTVSSQLAGVLETMADQFREEWPTSGEVWLPEGVPPRPGEVITSPAYAETLRRLQAVAAGAGAERFSQIEAVRREWREGFVAAAITDFIRTPHLHSTGTRHSGLITRHDLAQIAVGSEAPVVREFRGVRVAKASFWSQGPVLLQALAILDQFDDAHLDPGTALGAHTILEALKLAMADRDSWYGDVDHADVWQLLLSDDHAGRRAALIGETASLEFRPSHVGERKPYLPPLITGADETWAGTGEPTVGPNGVTRGDTCHVDVIDRFGNIVAVTPSGGWLQSSPAIPALGFCLGTRLQMTWLDEASPAALLPGRRPRTTLSPTILVRDDVPVTALGTPGGDQQDQWQLLYVLRTVVGGYSPQQAIDAPNFHTTATVGSFWPRHWTPGGVACEERLGSHVLAELRERGHRVTVAPPWSLGRLSCVGRDPATGALFAAANPRGAQGYAAGR